MNQKWCGGCTHLEYDETSDEMYCKLKDYEQIWLRRYKHRPDWCPLVTRRMNNEKNKNTFRAI